MQFSCEVGGIALALCCSGRSEPANSGVLGRWRELQIICHWQDQLSRPGPRPQMATGDARPTFKEVEDTVRYGTCSEYFELRYDGRKMSAMILSYLNLLLATWFMDVYVPFEVD